MAVDVSPSPKFHKYVVVPITVEVLLNVTLSGGVQDEVGDAEKEMLGFWIITTF